MSDLLGAYDGRREKHYLKDYFLCHPNTFDPLASLLSRPLPLTYLIIIMLQSFNSLLVSPQHSNQAQRIVTPINTIIPQPSVQSFKSQSSSIQQHSITSRNHKMKLQCMGELRHIFSCLRREERNRSIQIAAANCVQSLLLLLNKQERSGNQVKQEKSQEEIGVQEMVESPLKFQRIVEKPIKPQGELILILHSSTVSPTGNGNFFHLEMLSRESKIVHKSINFASLSLVRQEVQKIKKINSKICILVDDLRSPIQCESIYSELSPLISTFSQLSEHLVIKEQSHEEIKDLLSHSHQHRIQRSIIQVVRKYISIRQFIEYRLKAEWGSSIISVLTATAAYNILACLPNTLEKKIEQTLGYFIKVIQKAIHQQWKKEVSRHSKAAANLYHYPSSLQNAQKCWKCEKKRVYTFCPTCASTQGKVFALCLTCYSKYETHQLLREGNKAFFQADKMRAWKQLDLDVEEMVNEEIYDHLVDTRYQGYPN